MLDEARREKVSKYYRGEVSVPTGMRYLMELCGAVAGSSLPPFREMYKCVFLTGYAYQEEDSIRERVFDLDSDEFDSLEVGSPWQVANRYRYGEGPDLVGGFALFCQNEKEGKPWAWRYGI